MNQAVHYAIQSLLYFAQEPGKVVSARTLSVALKMHRPFLRKVLQILGTHKILKPLKGQNGGFVLNVNPNKLPVLKVVHIFGVRLNLVDCIFQRKSCAQAASCTLRKSLMRIEGALRNELRKITLATLRKNMHSV